MPLLFYYVSCIFRCANHCALILIEIITSCCVDLHTAPVLHEDAVMSAARNRKTMRQIAGSLHVARIVQSVHNADPECAARRRRGCRHMDRLSLAYPELIAHHARARRHIPVKCCHLIRTQQRADHLKLRIRILQGIVSAGPSHLRSAAPRVQSPRLHLP